VTWWSSGGEAPGSKATLGFSRQAAGREGRCRYIQTGVPPIRVSRPLASRCRLTGKGAMVSGSGVCAKRIVVDACHHMLGHLSSIIAKELLNDQKVVIVHYEEIYLSVGLAHQEVI
jgi:hypothetical protein